MLQTAVLWCHCRVVSALFRHAEFRVRFPHGYNVVQCVVPFPGLSIRDMALIWLYRTTFDTFGQATHCRHAIAFFKNDTLGPIRN